ncbi:MAG: bifunctional phosphoglucose/phosphomannose isomerase [Bacteroidetes bacterium]|nr:bifunctional phosphoglucose/phosphomannose isomerase [Bacteroidota bacterium]
MYKLIQEFPAQLQEAIEIGAEVELPRYHDTFTNICVLGLGGSAFGGEIIKDYGFDILKAPYSIFRGYTLPAYVGSGSLVIASSYSGNTEETLTTAELARQRGARVICVTSGGQLAAWAREHQLDLITIPGGRPPRASCGYSIVQQLFILHSQGLIPDFKADLEEALQVLDGFSAEAQARELGHRLKDRAVAIYSSDAAESAAIRLRQQINENGKQLCWHHVVPEMNHNELVGWEFPRFMCERSLVIQLRTAYDHPRVNIRWEICQGIYESRGAEVVNLQAQGKGKLAQLLWLLHFSDYVSWYLAEANGAEATPVRVIDHLKGELARRF